MDIKEIAKRIRKTNNSYMLSMSPDIAAEFAEALISAYKAELLKEVGEPFGFYYEINGTWDAAAAVLKAIKPLEDQLAAAQEELRAANSECDLFRKNGRISDANEIATLKDQLAKAEQRVAEYNELIYAVQTKNPDETRHQTALRYIRNAENRQSYTAAAGASS